MTTVEIKEIFNRIGLFFLGLFALITFLIAVIPVMLYRLGKWSLEEMRKPQ